MTYEVVIYFAQASTKITSDVIVTVDGHEVFAESREEFAPGAGSIPEYHSKRFQARAGASTSYPVPSCRLSSGHHNMDTDMHAGPDGMQIVVSSLNGFPPISGMEVSQIKAKSGAVGMTLLDRADDHIVVACGSKVFQQSPGGEILYPGPEAFTSAGLTLTRIAATITPADPALADLVAGGAFREMCTTAAGGSITATFNVRKGQEYTIIPYFAEPMCAPPPVSRVMQVICAQLNCTDLAAAEIVQWDRGCSISRWTVHPSQPTLTSSRMLASTLLRAHLGRWSLPATA